MEKSASIKESEKINFEKVSKRFEIGTEFLRDQAQKSCSIKDVVLLISVTI
ncbi:hypothetical protein [Orientia tsutsugamushi]|uniref:hypothetical protein n=1 Tax=Orientia tsutsugamushi TaxID=784 RepID=UPI00352863DE